MDLATRLEARSPWLRRDDPAQERADRARFTADYAIACKQLSDRRPHRLCLAASDPVRFLAQFCAAVVTQTPVFLCNPRWQAQEWQQVGEIVQPDLMWGLPEDQQENKGLKPLACPPQGDLDAAIAQINGQGIICIPTGGSSGRVKFAIHIWDTLTAAVTGFYDYFDRRPVQSYCVLPLYHVSGLMQALRAILTGGQVWIGDYHRLKQGQFPTDLGSEVFLSLVPTQLQQILTWDDAPQWLRQFRAIFIGGAPANPALLDRAADLGLPLAPTYGMTETAAQIATLKPADFLAGKRTSGPVLPHAQIESLPDQRLQIRAASLCWGYYPELWRDRTFTADDLGQFDPQGHLTLLGRQQRQIITGGENVAPEEIEAAILATGQVADVCVVGLPDPVWGEAIAALYAPMLSEAQLHSIQTHLRRTLAPHKIPKQWHGCAQLPRNAQGKLDYGQMSAIAQPPPG